MFRHSLCLAGGATGSDSQCGAVVKAAVNACETYYQAFQFVLWADRRRARPSPLPLSRRGAPPDGPASDRDDTESQTEQGLARRQRLRV